MIIGNEPNLNRFWMPQFDADGGDVAAPAYLALLIEVYDAVKHADPDLTRLGRRAGAARDRPPGHRPRHPLADDVHPRPRRRLPRQRPQRAAARRLRLPPLPGELERAARPADRSGVDVDPDGRLRGEAAAAPRRGVRSRPAGALQRARRRDTDPAREGVPLRGRGAGDPVDEATQADFYVRAIELAACQDERRRPAPLPLARRAGAGRLPVRRLLRRRDGEVESGAGARRRRNVRYARERRGAERPVRRVHVLQGRPGLAAAAGRGAHGDEGRVRRGRRGLERPLRAPACLLDDGRPARRRLLPLEDHGALRRPRRARRRPERDPAGGLARDALQLSCDDEGLRLHAGAAAAEDHPEGLALPRRLPVREGAAVVRAAAGGPPAGDGRAHPRRPRVRDDSTTTRRTRSGSTTRSS